MNPLIIGAGGVASYLVPILVRTFKDAQFFIMDGDRLEERNLDRQVFDQRDIGNWKVCGLSNKDGSGRIVPIPKFYHGSPLELANIPVHGDIRQLIDYVICVADNHEARKFALELGDDLHRPVFIAANELFDSEAYVYYHDWKGTPRDPRVAHPSILTDRTGSPLHCQEEQQASPQLAVANFAAAAKCATMVWRWMVETEKKNKIHLHHENIYETIVK
jgi:hypothetical protein